MYTDMPYQSYHTPSPDPVDELISQILADIPDAWIPQPTTSHAYAYGFEFASAFPSAPVPEQDTAWSASSTPFVPTPSPHLTCRWVSRPDYPHICGALLSADPKYACRHMRIAHNVRGNEKETVGCLWHQCRAPPMQRGSLIRHILTVHLGLLRWRCEGCGRVFSRKGTGHICVSGTSA
ncbi:hypothetical protein JVU11DRAFT_33 [Chiua virens]|nr:hypothetical protein JVU11DRAFT_33 [Chiua virens]